MLGAEYFHVPRHGTHCFDDRLKPGHSKSARWSLETLAKVNNDNNDNLGHAPLLTCSDDRRLCGNEGTGCLETQTTLEVGGTTYRFCLFDDLKEYESECLICNDPDFMRHYTLIVNAFHLLSGVSMSSPHAI